MTSWPASRSGQLSMRVLVTNMYAGLGGGELCLLQHVRHLLESGSDVSLLLLEHGELESQAAALGVRCTVAPFAWQGGKLRSALLLLRLIARVWWLITKTRADLVFCYTFNDFVIAGAAARLARKPVVYRTQGEVVPEKPEVGGNWLGVHFPRFCRWVRATLVSTTVAESRALRGLGVPAERVTCVYLGTPKPAPELLQRASRSGGAPRIGLFGRLVQWKGQDTFIAALGELKSRQQSFDAIIVGGSSFGDGRAYEDALRRLIQKLDLQDQVTLLGYRRDVAPLMADCDIVCHCSTFEPFGMVLIEAMMLGRPVIASKVRGPKEIVVEGQTGLLVEPRDPEQLADAIQTLFADPELRRAMGMRARRRAVEKFSLNTSLEQLDEACAVALRGRSVAGLGAKS